MSVEIIHSGTKPDEGHGTEGVEDGWQCHVCGKEPTRCFMLNLPNGREVWPCWDCLTTWSENKARTQP